MIRRVRWTAACAALILAGCSTTLLAPAKVDYKKAEHKLPPLDVPPDLTPPPGDEGFQIPEAPSSGTTTFSAYDAGRSRGSADRNRVLPQNDKARIERSGSERWLVVSEPPEKVWPIVKQFWQEQGFAIKVEHPEAGVMETDWAENRAKVDDSFFAKVLGGLADWAYSSDSRDKFRTRLERGVAPNTTEVYITHRGVAEVYTSESHETKAWQPRPPDPGLEAEFLQRLLVKFGVDEAHAKEQVAAAKKADAARIVTASDGTRGLQLAEPFDRAWRRVGLVLDRAGFTVEDRDRSKGFYFVRYVDVERDAEGKKKESSVLDSLMFWNSKPDPKPRQYRVFVKDRDAASEVQVLDKEGKPDSSDAAGRILALLQQQLK
jgi:outer membrane protein assembly factor BamC